MPSDDPPVFVFGAGDDVLAFVAASLAAAYLKGFLFSDRAAAVLARRQGYRRLPAPVVFTIDGWLLAISKACATPDVPDEPPQL